MDSRPRPKILQPTGGIRQSVMGQNKQKLPHLPQEIFKEQALLCSLQVAEAGGNSVRVWVHVEGDSRWIIEIPVKMVIHRSIKRRVMQILSLNILPFSHFVS